MYVDIVKKSALDQKLSNESVAATQFDYISYPIRFIIKHSEESCPHNGLLSADSPQHFSRYVDDIYVSLPIPLKKSLHCMHESAKLANVYELLPESIKSECHVSANMPVSDYFFGVESSTGDIVVKTDWCLFDPMHTTQIVLKMSCGVAGKVMGWDQMVHLVIHRHDSTGKEVDSHPIHRIRREMRNQAPFFDQPLYIASVPEEQPEGISVTTIQATDPESSELKYSMTSLLDSRSQRFFELDAKSGIVSTVGSLDREMMDVHYFRIIAMDSGSPPRTGTGTLQVFFRFVSLQICEFAS